MNCTRHPDLDDFRFGQTRDFEFAGVEEFLELHCTRFLIFLLFSAAYAALVRL
jgi:hypothetical protein